MPHCRRCGRILKSPDSINRELGAVCERKLQAAKAALVDGETIKTDTWYILKDGEFTEVEG